MFYNLLLSTVTEGNKIGTDPSSIALRQAAKEHFLKRQQKLLPTDEDLDVLWNILQNGASCGTEEAKVLEIT